MKKRNKHKPDSLKTTQNTEPESASRSSKPNDQNFVDQIIDKVTGDLPYESDKAVIRAKINDAACQPQTVDDLTDPQNVSISPSKSPTFTSGGGGFDYEDFVAAYHMCMMLLERTPLGNDFGKIDRLLWQAGDTGWLFDDIVVCNASGLQAGLSVKTDVHLNTNGFSPDFVKRAWAQFQSTCGRTFQSGDLICLAEQTISTDVQTAWRLLSSQLKVTSSNRMISRLETGEDDKNPQSSELQRKLVQSLIDKSEQAAKPTMSDALQLLKNIRVLPFDFLSQPSRDEDSVIQSLQYAVEGGAREDAQSLWKELLIVSKSMRRDGGDIEREKLAARVSKSQIKLRSLPNYETHLEKWHQQSTRRLKPSSWGVHGDSKPLERPELWESLSALGGTPLPMLFSGTSGSGKTSLAKEVAFREKRRCYLLDERICSSGGLIQSGLFVGTSYSVSDLLQSENHDCLLLIDACEKFEDEYLEAVLSNVVELASTGLSNRIKIILTCISTQSDRIAMACQRFGIRLNVVPIAKPETDEIVCLLADETKSLKIENKPQLQEVLTNLKVLDLYVRAMAAGVISNDTGDMNSSKLYDFLWNDWINRGNRSLERGRLLQRIALECSKRLVQTLPVLELESHEATLLEGLDNDGLVNCADEVVFFTHDFIRDLCRSKMLVSDSTEEIVAKALDYPWHGAIRLYAQKLASNDFSNWNEEFQAALNQTSNWHICHTLFLEGLVQAAEANPNLIVKIWDVCGDGDRQNSLRENLLECILVATPIDQRWSGPVSQELLAGAGPWRKYDSAVIQELFKMATEETPGDPVILKSLLLICEMTFRRRLSGEELPVAHISNVTNFALKVAETLINGDRSCRLDATSRKTVYRSLLLSVMGDPSRATELILTAAKRRNCLVEEQKPESDNSSPLVQGGGVAPILFEGSDNEDPEPWPHGPLDRVNDDFRKVCLESDLLLPLIIVSPEVAKEVLFACVIEHPRSRSRRRYSSEPEIGLVDYITQMNPFYDVGPFLDFFRINPEHALDFVVSITNFAAENWSKSQHRIDLDTRAFDQWGSRLGPFEFKVPSASSVEPEDWKGNGNIYCWSAGGLPTSKTITCALMAFEHWAYQSLKAEKDIDRLLEQAVSESRNAGMAGCLIDIGKKHPNLFRGPLRELLGCWAFYAWDAAKVLQNSSMPPLMIGLGMTTSARRVKLIADWFKQSHRTRDLIRIAASLLVRDETFREFIEDCRQRWQPEDAERFSVHQLKHLLSVFDWSNYKIEDQNDGTQLVSYLPPEEMLKEAAAISAELDNKQLLLMFPFQCREIMKKGDQLDEKKFNWIWSSIQKVAELPATDAKDADPMDDPRGRRVNCISAGVATLLSLGENHANKEVTHFCRSHFESLMSEPPGPKQFDMPETHSEFSWDYSFADMTIAYLTEDVNDEAARWGVSRCVTAYHYLSLEHFMDLSLESRAKFPELFKLLPRYISLYAALREIVRRVGEKLGHAESCFRRWQEDCGTGHYEGKSRLELFRKEYGSTMKLFDQFNSAVANCEIVDDTWPKIVKQSVDELQQMSKRLDTTLHFRDRDDNDRSLGHLDIGIDLDLVRHGFDWIDLSCALDDEEFRSWVTEIKGLIDLRRTLVPELKDNQKFRQWDYGHKFDTFVMSLVCRNIVGSLESDTSECWRPMLDDISIEPKFVDDFLSHFNALVYDAKSPPRLFVQLWAEMIEYALESSAWSGQGVPAGQWKSMLGMSFSAQLQFPEIDPAWSNAVSLEISKRRAVFIKAIDLTAQAPFVFSVLIEDFGQPLWRSLRLDILERLAARPLTIQEEAVFPADATARFLAVCWSEHSRQIVKQPKVEKSFQLLLSMSIRAGSTVGKELGRLAGLVQN